MRIAFTIILNGLHHMLHNNYDEFLLNTFDYWVVVEGAAQSKGSTYWCKKMPDYYHNNGNSVDGTVDHLKELQTKYNNLVCVFANGMWNSKDDMVNKAIDEIKKITNECFLWEIDIDEQWNKEQIEKSEIELIEKNGKTGLFYGNQFVGEGLVAYGKNDWGGSTFNRLWNWKGEYFATHESPILVGGNDNCVILSEIFNHYAYYFEQDVKFKNDWYGGHDGCYEGWLKLKKEINFPQHISYMFPYFRGYNSYIYKEQFIYENRNNM